MVAYYTISRENLRALRLHRRMTQVKLANAAGVAEQTITRMETGTHTPQFETLEKVAAALGTDPENFIIHHTQFRSSPSL